MDKQIYTTTAIFDNTKKVFNHFIVTAKSVKKFCKEKKDIQIVKFVISDNQDVFSKPEFNEQLYWAFYSYEHKNFTSTQGKISLKEICEPFRIEKMENIMNGKYFRIEVLKPKVKQNVLHL